MFEQRVFLKFVQLHQTGGRTVMSGGERRFSTLRQSKFMQHSQPCSSSFACSQYTASCTKGCCFVVQFSVRVTNGSWESRESLLKEQSCNSRNDNSKGRQLVTATYPTTIRDKRAFRVQAVECAIHSVKQVRRPSKCSSKTMLLESMSFIDSSNSVPLTKYSSCKDCRALLASLLRQSLLR